MNAALLPDRGVVKVSGDDARRFLNGIITADVDRLAAGAARYTALLTPQGKIIVDFLVTEAPPEDGGGFFLDCPQALAGTLVDRLNFYRLRAKVTVEDLSAALGILAMWDGTAETDYGLCYPDPRLPALGARVILPRQQAQEAAADLGATLLDAEAYEAHRIGLAIPRGGLDFAYGDTFPHEADLDQLGGVDFDKGCYVGQEVVSRVEHRAIARSRVVAAAYDDFAPVPGTAVMAGEKSLGWLGSSAKGRALALLRLDRTEEAGTPINAGGLPIRPLRPSWARFPFSAAEAAE
jgi:folate-binding protein YgfZ